MKTITRLALFISLFVIAQATAFASPGDVIRNEVAKKFSQSCGATVRAAAKDGESILVTVDDTNAVDANCVVIDVAVALHRVNDRIGTWKQTSVAIGKKSFIFNRKVFEQLRSGAINDKQFLKQVKRK